MDNDFVGKYCNFAAYYAFRCVECDELQTSRIGGREQNNCELRPKECQACCVIPLVNSELEGIYMCSCTDYALRNFLASREM